MGGASKLLTLLTTPFPLLSRSPAAAALRLAVSSSAAGRRRRRHLTTTPTSSPSSSHLHTHAAAAAASISRDSFPDHPAASAAQRWGPEWSRLVDHLAAAGFASSCGSVVDALVDGEELAEEFSRAAAACLAFARERPELLGSLSRKDVEMIVENALPFLFKDGESSTRRLRAYLSSDGSNVYQSERAETVDVMRYLLSYAYDPRSASHSYSKTKEITDSAVRNLLVELLSVSGFVQTSSFVESTPKQPSLGQHEQFSRPPGQNIEMKRGDWICPRCSFMNFARNARCLDCNEIRPKRILTGGEWECPQCDFYNYGRNMSCLRCDCKRPVEIRLNPTSPGGGLGCNRDSSVAQTLNGTNTGESEIERKLAANDEKAERWLSKVSQLDDSSDVNSLAADEDFPEIMPMRKGVNRFVVSTRKTPLERRLANAQYNSNTATPRTDTSSDSKISQTLDRILGRSTSASGTSSQPAAPKANIDTRHNLGNQQHDLDSVPFVPLPADMFAKPRNADSEAQAYKDDQMITKTDNSIAKSAVTSRDDKVSLDTAEKWSKKVSELDRVTDLSSAIPDEDFPEIMPMRKGENRFVISKKKDRSLTSPQYKRRIAMDQANNANFVPFVPFPPGYFAKKDKPAETSPPVGPSSGSSQSVEKAQHLPTNMPANTAGQSFGSNSNMLQGVDHQSNSHLNTGGWDVNSQQNFNESNGGYAYGKSGNYPPPPTSQGMGSQSNTGSWNMSYSENANYSAQPPYTSRYDNSNNCWNSKYSDNSSFSSYQSGYNNSNNNWNGEYSNNSSSSSYQSGYNSSNNSWNSQHNSSPSSAGATINPNQPGNYSNSGENWNRGFARKSLEGSAVKEPDPLDMSEEAKAERWFRRAAQIKDISELANIPDEDFPEIMPMRKGVNRFVVSKRKTPLERRLTSPQYKRNLPIVSSEPEKDAS